MNMSFKNKVFLFWGCMDAMFIVHYLYRCISAGKAPLAFELDGLLFSLEVGDLLYALFPLASIVLTLSIALSCALFLARKRVAVIVALIQEPLRLMFFVPSILLFIPTMNGVILIIWLVVSEILKCFTLLKAVKDKSND